MLPTDFVAKWLSFLGRCTLYWADFTEPNDDRERDFLLLSLGFTSLAVAIVTCVAIIPTLSNTLDGILKVDSTPEWFLKIGGVLARVVTVLVFSPLTVGFVYRNWGQDVTPSARLGKAFVPSFALLFIAVGTAAVTHSNLIGKAILSASSIPLIIAVCPTYVPIRREKVHRRHTNEGPGRRFRVKNRVTEGKTSA